jgi:hypothetical protein
MIISCFPYVPQSKKDLSNGFIICGNRYEVGENLLDTFSCRVYVMDEGRGIYGGPNLVREVTKKEEVIIIFNLIAGSAKVINICGKAGSSVCSR